MSNKQFEKFNNKWKIKPVKLRGIKFFLDVTPQQEKLLIEYQSRHKSAVNFMSQQILTKLKDKSITLENVSRSRDSKFANSLWKNDDAVNRHLEQTLGLYKERQKRGTTFLALRFYRGYNKRNKELPDKSPRLRTWSKIYLEEGIVSYKKDHLNFSIHEKNGKFSRKLKIPYKIPKGMIDNLQYLSDGFGGNLSNHKGKWHYTALAKIPFRWQYEPVSALGFDLNKTSQYFITFSSSIMFNDKEKDKLGHTSEMKKAQKLLVDLNEQLKSKIKSSQRSAIRQKVIKAHKKLEKLCLPYCEAIIAHAVKNKQLICIDPLSCGAKTGSFGQDKIVSLLTKMCEDRCIPFVHVPTPHTSKACNRCMKECERPEVDKLICPDCGELDAHRNASFNITAWGLMIWNDGFGEFVRWKKENYKKKNSGLTSRV